MLSNDCRVASHVDVPNECQVLAESVSGAMNNSFIHESRIASAGGITSDTRDHAIRILKTLQAEERIKPGLLCPGCVLVNGFLDKIGDMTPSSPNGFSSTVVLNIFPSKTHLQD